MSITRLSVSTVAVALAVVSGVYSPLERLSLVTQVAGDVAAVGDGAGGHRPEDHRVDAGLAPLKCGVLARLRLVCAFDRRWPCVTVDVSY
jgi:hypothetical protein